MHPRYPTGDSCINRVMEDNDPLLLNTKRRALDESNYRQIAAKYGRQPEGPDSGRPADLQAFLSWKSARRWTRLKSLARHDPSEIVGVRPSRSGSRPCVLLLAISIRARPRLAGTVPHDCSTDSIHDSTDAAGMAPCVHVVLRAQPKLGRYLPRQWKRPCCG